MAVRSVSSINEEKELKGQIQKAYMDLKKMGRLLTSYPNLTGNWNEDKEYFFND